MSPPLCRCTSVSHERKDCRLLPILSLRQDLYRDLFDSGVQRVARKRVNVLNAGYQGEDAVAQHFALLEIDD